MHKHVCMYMCVLALLCFVHLSGGQITGRVYEAICVITYWLNLCGMLPHASISKL